MATIAPGAAAGPHHAVLDHIHPEPQTFIRKYIFSIDHKIIGIQYIITAFLFYGSGRFAGGIDSRRSC